MPVSSTHPDYDRYQDDWRTLRDAFAGSTAVRTAADRYLPRPGGMKGTPERDAQWQAYLARPEWLNATRRTIQGLTGCVFRKPPTISGLDTLPHLLDQNVTGTGVTLAGFLQELFRETLHMGRAGILVDLPAQPQTTPEPQWTLYHTEDILNWRLEYRQGRPIVTMVVLRERREEPDEDEAVAVTGPDGETTTFFFDTQQFWQFRVLTLDVEGRYRVDLWREEVPEGETDIVLTHTETLFPSRRGESLPFLPFVFLGPRDLEPSVEPSPVWDLVRINLRHWRHSADYEHGLHYTALPTPWITGHNPEFDQTAQDGITPPQIVLGSGEAIVLPEDGARIGLLSLSDSEFGALRRALDEDKTEMALLGARLLEERPQVNETATAVRLRQSGDESVLRTLAQAVARGSSQALRIDAWWRGILSTPQTERVGVALNTDFLSLRLAPQEIVALMQLQQAGQISSETLYHNLVQGEIAQEGVSFEDEQARIAANPPVMLRLTEPEEDADAGADAEG